jgi:ligand-binding sensor domain-containing protein
LRKIFLLLIASLLVTVLHAQRVDQYFFAHFNTLNGLVSNQTNMLVQDNDGYLWIASADGLQRFDGVRFKTFTPDEKNPSSIPHKNVIQILPHDRDHFWILTDRYDVGLFNTKTFRYTSSKITIRDRTASQHTRKMIKDEDGNVMFLYARSEVLTWNKERNEFSEAYNFIPLKGRKISDIIQQPGTKNYWIGTDSGLVIYNRATRTISEPLHNRAHEVMVDSMAKVDYPAHFLFDRKGRVWFSYWEPSPVAACYDVASGEPVLYNYDFKPYFKSYYEIKGFMEQSDGSIWIKGLKLFARYNEQEKTFSVVENGFQKEQGIVYEHVAQLYEDREKNIWVVTNNKGLYRFNPSRQFFTSVAHVNIRNGLKGNGSVMSFAETNDGNLLAGSWDDGLYMYDKTLKEIPFTYKALEKNRFLAAWSMYASADSNTIWISSQPGFYAFNQLAGTLHMYNPPQFNNRTIRQVLEDKYGNLWFGLQSFGVFKWNAADVHARNTDAIQRIDEIASVSINKLATDKKGNVWIATGSAGLYVVDPRTNKLVLHADDKSKDSTRLLGNAISSVLNYAADTMIVTTATEVFLYKLSTGNIKKLGNSASLSGYIAAVVRDAKGFLWLSTTSGIYKVNMRTESFTHFDETDGLSDIQFTLSSSMVLPDNRIIFGSSEMVAFNPLTIESRDSLAKIKITEFMVRNSSLLVDSIMQLKKLSLEPADNSIAIEFSTLSFSPSHSRIKYKLDGLDKEWKYADNSNRAVYSYLPPGGYTFLITSENADGEESGKVSTLYLEVQAHFWQTWWFYGLLLLLAATLFYWFDSERMKRKAELQRMRENIAGNLHEQINTALGNINILSEMAKRKADTDPEKSKDYIEQIHTKSGNMMMAMDDMLWSIDPGNDSMQKTLERIREYTEALENEKGIETELWVDQNVTTVSLNMKLRYEAFQLLKEVLNSLDEDGKCKVHVGLEHGKLEFIIQYENEVGNMEAISCLNQKADLQKRLHAAGAELDVQVHRHSSLVELQIPV